MPKVGRRVPISTYRIQLQPEFTFDDARSALPYLKDLGVTDLYLSPILQSVPGSTHGYDVVDHSQISEGLGGRDGFRRLAQAAHEVDMGVFVDVVPNHMAVPTPLYLNKALWSVLRDGPDSPYATWFDDSPSTEGFLMPVLGSRIGTVIANNEITLDTMVVPGHEDDGEVHVLRYFDHVFPVAPGTETLPMTQLVERQSYRLAFWKVADEELNYRRFFDVDTLAAIRVEDDDVFDATHAVLLEEFHAGNIDGFRIDHPDGLAAPRDYLARLSEATGGAWITAEKILEGSEQLPGDWPIAGTTGYDSAWRIGALLTDASGAAIMANLQREITGRQLSLDEEEHEGKRLVASTSLYAEIHRVAALAAEICRSDIRLRDHTFRALLECTLELVIAIPRYRAYVIPFEPPSGESVEVITEAAALAAERMSDDRAETLEVLVDLVLGREVGSAGKRHEAQRAEIAIRFQQTCGAVMGKGVEDTAFYRWTHLLSGTEVGGAPQIFALSPDAFHAWMSQVTTSWPATQSAGTTHDNKRSEDVRTRISVISQYAEEWAELVSSLSHKFTVDGVAANVAWQILAGTWTPDGPISADRFAAYLLKASREAKLQTSWTHPDPQFEADLDTQARALISDPEVIEAFEGWVARTSHAVRSTTLAHTALHLTACGVADVFNGTETTQTFLVDPDNRAPMPLAHLEEMAETLRTRKPKTLPEEKFVLTREILRLRSRKPDVFVGGNYKPLAASTGQIVAYCRGESVCTVAIRVDRHYRAAGGAGEHTVVLPEGTWRDILNGHEFEGGECQLAELLTSAPVAVLERI